MPLCTVCQSVDFRALFITTLRGYMDWQEATRNGQIYDDISVSPDGMCKFGHHDDIFMVAQSSANCDLCRIIFEAFQKRLKEPNAIDEAEARGLKLLLRANHNGLGVFYDTCEGMVRLCWLDFFMSENNVNKLFDLCKIKEDESPPVLKTMDQHPGSEAALNLARGWLKHCSKNHSSCKPHAELRRPPKRLIDVGHETQKPLLLEFSPQSQPVAWLSLSYCWGEEPTLKLCRENLDELKSGISLDTLDPTIRDAILVSRALDIPYIWVDALCIIQGDNETEWAGQATRMNEVYGGSTLTLAAASAKSVKHGFLNRREFQYVPVLPLMNPTNMPDDANPAATLFLSPEWNKDNDEIGGPWAERGWTMQESLLPNRLLIYTSSQVIWKCCEEMKFERGITRSLQSAIQTSSLYSDDAICDPGWIWGLDTFIILKKISMWLPETSDYPHLLEPDAFRLWYTLIEDYTHRRFERIGDRLIAIAGLAKILSDIVRCREYVAGLWVPDLIRGLMWHTEGAQLVPRHSMQNVQVGFPSWSWASIDYRRIKHSPKHKNGLRELSQIEDVHVELADPLEPFGSVERGKLTITGPLIRIPMLYNKYEKSSEKPVSEIERYISRIVEAESSGDVEDTYSSPLGGHFAVLQMLQDFDTIHLLVLEATRFKRANEYRRVGAVTLQYLPRQSTASPTLIARLHECEKSLSARLGPQVQKGEVVTGANDVFRELRDRPWKKETIVIV